MLFKNDNFNNLNLLLSADGLSLCLFLNMFGPLLVIHVHQDEREILDKPSSGCRLSLLFAPLLPGMAFAQSGRVLVEKKTIIKKTSLHLLSEVSADITSGITSNITSAAEPKPQDFLFVCFSIYIL